MIPSPKAREAVAALHLVEPGGVGGCVVDVEAGPLGQPGTNFDVLVGAVVVDDQVDVEILRDGLLDLAEEAEELLVPVARPALGQHLPRGHVERREQGCGAVTDGVVGDALDLPQTHGQQRLTPVQSLDLRLLIDAEDDRLVGRVEVEADEVPNFFHENRIRRVLIAVRLPRSGGPSAGGAELRRSAAIADPPHR
jgi:hypothetical protein